MILLVDLEDHASLARHPELADHFAGRTLALKYLLEELSGQTCLIVSFERLSWPHPEPSRVVVGGHYTGYDHYRSQRIEPLREFLRSTERPLLSICGGMHQLAWAFGGEVTPLGEATETPHPIVGGRGEFGFQRMSVRATGPLFEGLGEEPEFFQLHSWEVTRVPDGFDVLASNQTCAIQAIGHRSRPLFGVQFHPEKAEPDRNDGLLLLRNFLTYKF